jgi:hypothetical protein
VEGYGSFRGLSAKGEERGELHVQILLRQKHYGGQGRAGNRETASRGGGVSQLFHIFSSIIHFTQLFHTFSSSIPFTHMGPQNVWKGKKRVAAQKKGRIRERTGDHRGNRSFGGEPEEPEETSNIEL